MIRPARRYKAIRAVYGETRPSRHLDENHWFYDGPEGVTVAAIGKGTLQSVIVSFVIPWRKLSDAVHRRERYLRLLNQKPKKRKKPAAR